MAVLAIPLTALLAPSAQADVLDEAVDCAVLNGVSCVHVQDARTWAEDVTMWKFGNRNHHNNMGDAFRHCAWIGSLTTRIGQQDAYRVGFAHEEYDAGQPAAERAMDEWNNFVGAGIGAAAVRSGARDQWGYVLKECESRARNYTLYGLEGIQGGYAR
ncbi:hypothetical protein K3M35_16870 [Rhodococcus sp. DMU2021]|uniref:DUF6973 domain-containing protein n=1 Tax=Rhodococcus sp. DMU2021 TaxID=2866997 RepID=UPI001C7D4F38|nr:hypothetical protein [Rhodococcus sp. DMU2021]MBX4170310.1 hypothetical protein [Rhodococcus sp. DMU2021]